MLSQQAVSEYQAIYKKAYGVEIPTDVALEQATKLLRMFKIIYRPIPLEKGRKKLEKNYESA